jgi:hypothetical protein
VAYDFAERQNLTGDIQMDDPRITPSRWYYVLAGLVFVTGMVLFAVFLVKSISGMGSKLQRMVAPGETELALSEPGTYTIFYEYRSVIGNTVYSTGGRISGLACAVVAKPGNTLITLVPSLTNTTYNFGGRSGRSLFEFRIASPGVYTLSARYPEGQKGPQVVLAVGKDFTAGIFVTILGALGLLFASIGIAVAITLVTLIKRIKKKKLLVQTAGSHGVAPAREADKRW